MLALRILEERYEALDPRFKQDSLLTDIMRKARYATQHFGVAYAAYQAQDDEFVIGGDIDDSHSAIHYNSVMYNLTSDFDARETHLLNTPYC